MPKNWTRIAATLLLVGLALPASATEYGAWKLIDTKTSKEFSPDAAAPTDRFGTWNLIDVQYSKAFLSDVDNPYVSRYGQWELADVNFDRRWLSDQFIRQDDLGSSEVDRDLVSDEVEKGKVLKDSGKKVFTDPRERLLNPVQKEVVVKQYKRRDSGRPVSTLVEQYRIDTTYDKEVSHPWSQTYTYGETEKHTKTYDVTYDHKVKLVFKDPVTGQQINDYKINTSKGKDVQSTGTYENGKRFTVTDSGVVVDPLFKVTQAGAVKERELGKSAESASAASNAEAATAVAFSSNSQVGNIRKVSYAGTEDRKALAIDKTKLSQAKKKNPKAIKEDKDDKAKDVKDDKKDDNVNAKDNNGNKDNKGNNGNKDNKGNGKGVLQQIGEAIVNFFEAIF